MNAILTEPLTGPAAWKGRDLKDDPSWVHILSDEETDALDAALAAAKARGRLFPATRREDVPLPALAPLLARIADALEDGPGFVLLRGLPVEGRTEAEVATLHYALGLHLGTPVTQNPRGDLIGRVEATGDPTRRETRVYQTDRVLPYHTDPSDVVGLLCLRRAKAGGESSLVSAASIHNALLEDAPESLGALYRPFHYAHLSTEGAGRSPLFSYHGGKLACRYLRQYIELGHEQQGEPLTAVERAALDAFDAAMNRPDLALDMMLEPGDLQLANNYMVLHARTEFEDDPAHRRLMLRLWLKMANARALAPDFPGRNGFGASRSVERS